ncbi:HNH endonuclease [Candidatus Kaiserbacteria bacterium]|nr:HNH endonuclease [Candidatus Kaiserbacteria bacterium]
MAGRKRRWSEKQLMAAVRDSSSFRQVLAKIGLVEAGGNYDQVKRYVRELSLDVSHFKGKAWNKGLRGQLRPIIPTAKILVVSSNFQSYKLKKRLFSEGLKRASCEECGWAQRAEDGRLPLELDHINGDRHDNRIENLRILCPNCHSLKPTHRGRNMRRRDGGTGIRATLKMS